MTMLGLAQIRKEGMPTFDLQQIFFFFERKVKGGWVCVPFGDLIPNVDFIEQFRWKIPFNIDLFGMLSPEVHKRWKTKYSPLRGIEYKPRNSKAFYEGVRYEQYGEEKNIKRPKELLYRNSLTLLELLLASKNLRKCGDFFVDEIIQRMLDKNISSVDNIRAVFWFG